MREGQRDREREREKRLEQWWGKRLRAHGSQTRFKNSFVNA